MHECRKERKRRTYRNSNQRTHHTHTTKMPPKFRQNHDCTLQVSHVHRCQVSTYPTKHPEVSQCAKIQGFRLPKRPSKFPPIQQSTPKFRNTPKSQVSGYLKQPSKFRNVYPIPQTDTLQFPSLQNHLLSSQKVIKRHPEFLYAHEVREFRTIQRPNAPQPNTHTTPPKHFEVSDCLQNPHLSRENFTPWELDLSTARATANEHHILLTSSVSAPHAVYNVALLLRRRGTCSCTSSRPRTTAVNFSFVRLVAPLHFGRAIKHIIAKVA